MDAQIKSQLLGITLALTTAIGCIAYEKIVKNFSLSTIIFLAVTFYLPLLILMAACDHQTVTGDVKRLFADHRMRWYGLIYWLTWVTTPLWFTITKNQDVMVGSIYEVKYIVILAVFYVFLGERPMTINTIIGVVCALTSIYFISKK